VVVHLAWCALPLVFAHLSPADARLVRAAALWATMPVIFFSLSQSKLPSYVLPAWPGLALLVALGWDTLLALPRPHDCRMLAGLILVAAIVVALLAVYAFAFADARAYPDLMRIRTLLAGVMAAGAVAIGIVATLARDGRTRASLVALFAIAVLGLVGGQTLAKLYEPEKDVRQLARVIEAIRRPGERVVVYGMLEIANALPFYLRTKVSVAGFHFGELTFAKGLREPGDAETFLEYKVVFDLMRPTSQRAFFLKTPSVFKDFTTIPQFKLVELARRGDLVLYTNRP
jgi:4-amino-4-deoxy-L-arabinose transferase-like glycosyltransferase